MLLRTLHRIAFDHLQSGSAKGYAGGGNMGCVRRDVLRKVAKTLVLPDS